MFQYIATKGKESVLCQFDTLQDMTDSMLRHIKLGFAITQA